MANSFNYTPMPSQGFMNWANKHNSAPSLDPNEAPAMSAPIAGANYHDPFPALMDGGWVLEFISVPVGHGPGGTLSVKFPAAITKFSDNYKSTWKREAVYGRPDPIQAYSNTQRTISLGWQLASASFAQAVENLAATSRLIRMLYPPYHELYPASGGRPAIRSINGSPLIKLKFANLIANSSNGDELVGTLDGINHSPVIEAGFFTDLDGNMYPKMASFDCTFHPMHLHELGYSTSWEDEDAASLSPKSPKFKTFPYDGPQGPDPTGHLQASEVPLDVMWTSQLGLEIVKDPGNHQAAQAINILKGAGYIP